MPQPRKPKQPSAQILRFSPLSGLRTGRRGRPRSAPKGTDTGTPELLRKRQLGQTTESLDLCLERQLITQRQHWCGMHLRWLFTLRHGTPGLRAYDPALASSPYSRTEDNSWRQEREQEFREALVALSQCGSIAIVVNISVYNERPAFLNPPTRLSARQAQQNSLMLTQFSEGLEVLVKLWKR